MHGVVLRGNTASAGLSVLDDLHVAVDGAGAVREYRVARGGGGSVRGGDGVRVGGLMVSRGSSMLIEGIEEFKDVTGKWESAICMVSGITAGLLLGLESSMWKESVVINRISLFGVPSS